MRRNWRCMKSGKHMAGSTDRSPMVRYSLMLAVFIVTACGNSTSHRFPAVRFITTGHLDLWPCFSPDSTQVLFSRRENDTWTLYLVPASGGAAHVLSEVPMSVSATRANWSTQKNLIAFTGTTSQGRNGIWIVNADGTSSHELESRGASDQVFYPSWFPNGDQLAAMYGQEMVIKRIDVSTGSTTTITDHKQILTGMPSVSPSGKAIAFAGQQNLGQSYDQTRNIIWVVDEDGVSRALEANPGQGRAPSWSPDGSRLAFESSRGSPSGLYAVFVINRDGTNLIQVTDPDLNADHPVWAPDGHQLAFSARASMFGNSRGIAIIEAPAISHEHSAAPK